MGIRFIVSALHTATLAACLISCNSESPAVQTTNTQTPTSQTPNNETPSSPPPSTENLISQNQASPNPSISEIVSTYAASYRKVTDKEVYVNPELAASCVGATHQAVAAARLLHGPHANTAILIYMNDLAAATFDNNGATYPVGSVVVKQKRVGAYLHADGKFGRDAEKGVGGMVKRAPGYDTGHGDWEYFYFEDTSAVESGKISSCVQCHAQAKSKDHVFGSWRGQIPTSIYH